MPTHTTDDAETLNPENSGLVLPGEVNEDYGIF